jgi:hypothetical protein
MRKTRRSTTRRSATRRSATRKTHKHKRSQHKRSKYRRNKRGGAEDCGQLYLKCLKKEESHGIYTPRPEPPSPPPRKKRSPKPHSPPKENIYEAYEPDKGTPYENASNRSSLGKMKPPALPKRNKMSPNKYGFDNNYVSEEV